GFVVGLVVAAANAQRQGVVAKSPCSAYFVYLLLAYPSIICPLVMGGTLAWAIIITTALGIWTWRDLPIALGLGAGLGMAMMGLRMVAHTRVSRGLVLPLEE